MSEDDSRQQAHEAQDFLVPHEDCSLDQRGGVSGGGFSTGSGSPSGSAGRTSLAPAAAAYQPKATTHTCVLVRMVALVLIFQYFFPTLSPFPPTSYK